MRSSGPSLCVHSSCWPLVFSWAQGEGPRVYPLSPSSINALSLTRMDMSSNFTETILVEDSDLASDIWALNSNGSFSLGGRFAERWVTGIWGSIEGNMWRGRVIWVF